MINMTKKDKNMPRPISYITKKEFKELEKKVDQVIKHFDKRINDWNAIAKNIEIKTKRKKT